MDVLLGDACVGREREVRVIRSFMESAYAGQGGLVAVMGEPGVGKSRLVQEALTHLRAHDVVARGRGVDRGRPLPFRPVAEALLGVSRGRTLPSDPELAPYASALGRLVPVWRRSATAAEEPLVVMAEAVVRVMRALAEPGAAVVVLEDLQWADADTLAVVEYLAHNLAEEPLCLMVTVRSDTTSEGLDLVRALAARRVAALVELSRLEVGAVIAMVAHCLRTATPPDSVLELVERADGLPFLVEEILVAAAQSGALVGDAGGWQVRDGVALPVPESYADLVRRRVAGLEPAARAMARAAAVVGLALDEQTLAVVTGTDVWTAAASLRGLWEAGLMVHEPASASYAFRHALLREAILGELTNTERAGLARQALDRITAEAPALPGEKLELGVDLAEQAGELTRSARLLLMLAEHALAAGGIGTAEACLTRARRRTGGDVELAASIDEVYLRTLVAKGDLSAAATVGADLLGTLRRQGAAPRRQALVHVELACAAAAALAWPDADEHLVLARVQANEVNDGRLLARIAVLTAQVALGIGELGLHAHPGTRRDLAEGRADVARDIASAVTTDKTSGAEATCRAWMLLGRLSDEEDLSAAAEAYRAALDTAIGGNLALLQLLALCNLAVVEMLRTGSDTQLRAARERAEQMGAVALTAQVDTELAWVYSVSHRPESALVAAERAVSGGRRLHFPGLEPMALVQQATAHATREDRPAMEAALADALRLAPDDPDIRMDAAGHARGLYAVLRNDGPAALAAFDEAVAAAAAARLHGLFWAPWAILRLLQSRHGGGEESAQVLKTLAQPKVTALPINRGLVQYALAVAAGRQGRPEEAQAHLAAAADILRGQQPLGMWIHICRRYAAEAAIADGWGDPATWLREALTAFDGSGHKLAATACRSLLGRAGVPAPRRSGPGTVPAALAALGVTSRETDVLRLLAEGLTGREIGQRLYLSHRTVEKHVERLLAKTGTANRSQLIAWAAGRAPELRT